VIHSSLDASVFLNTSTLHVEDFAS